MVENNFNIRCDYGQVRWRWDICELVGLFLLSQMQDLNINIWLYRDDRLAITRQTLKEVVMTKKGLCKIFRENGLRITVEANKPVVDFLDITLNLRTNHIKNPNDTINYISCEITPPPPFLVSKTYQNALGYDFLRTHPVLKYFRKQ